MDDMKVYVKKVINAPIERVFDAWLDADTLANFMLPKPGMPIPRTEVDARVGGKFVCYMAGDDGEIPVGGEYLEIDRPNKIRFTWESPFSADGSTVTINFQAVTDDSTEIELLHLVFISEENRGDHEAGWNNIMETLAEQLRVAASA
jgi:uncharacterized protein YndB with AHSA1/START domain